MHTRSRWNCAAEHDERNDGSGASEHYDFGAYLKNSFGGKAFVMGLWQTGITWAPTTHMTETNFDGALKHIALNFRQWCIDIQESAIEHTAEITLVLRAHG